MKSYILLLLAGLCQGQLSENRTVATDGDCSDPDDTHRCTYLDGCCGPMLDEGDHTNAQTLCIPYWYTQHYQDPGREYNPNGGGQDVAGKTFTFTENSKCYETENTGALGSRCDITP